MLVLNGIAALGCLVLAGALVVGQNLLNKTHKIAAIAPTPPTSVGGGPADSNTSTNSPDDTGASPAVDTNTSAPAAFPAADPHAKNFLVTGSDNHACPDANTAYPVPPRDSLGERSDTIMVIRVDPSTSRAAILSFPRDLWVKIAGTNGSNRINAAYSVNDPQKLIDTIHNNFGIDIDHYIQVDFCAFTTLVKAVGGVAVPFLFPARDAHTGLNIPQAGCATLNGDEALAYARSRHYQYLDPKTNQWVEDPQSDYGRIARQQDFVRRTVAKILAQGTFNVGVVRSLIDVVQNDVVTDANLTIAEELQLAGVLRTINIDQLQTYRIVGTGVVIAGSDVILPQLGGANMKAILAIFKGKAQLVGAPTQTADTANSSPPITVSRPATAPGTTLPATAATEVVNGIYPPKTATCQ